MVGQTRREFFQASAAMLTLGSTVIGTFGRLFISKLLNPFTPTPDFWRSA
jgi:hypothetical protein